MNRRQLIERIRRMLLVFAARDAPIDRLPALERAVNDYIRTEVSHWPRKRIEDTFLTPMAALEAFGCYLVCRNDAFCDPEIARSGPDLRCVTA